MLVTANAAVKMCRIEGSAAGGDVKDGCDGLVTEKEGEAEKSEVVVIPQEEAAAEEEEERRSSPPPAPAGPVDEASLAAVPPERLAKIVEALAVKKVQEAQASKPPIHIVSVD